MIYCTQCGAGLPQGANFCSQCGSAVRVSAQVPRNPMVRPQQGRLIAGVCLGLARAYGWDVAVVRILAVAALVCSSGLIGVAYLAAWIGIPEEVPQSAPPCAPSQHMGSSAM
jgi:phage shock protein PspC (stress-responsive transcriptional regulator)